MNTIDKISKDVLGLFEYSKDVIKINLTNSDFTNAITPKLTNEQLSGLFKLIDLSIDQSFQKGITTFQKAVKNNVSNDASTLKDLDAKKRK